MGNFFEDTMTGLLQAISIEQGNLPVVEMDGMPAKTFCFVNDADKVSKPHIVSPNITAARISPK